MTWIEKVKGENLKLGDKLVGREGVGAYIRGPYIAKIRHINDHGVTYWVERDDREETVTNTLTKGAVGTIENKAGTLHGTVTREGGSSFDFHIDGVKLVNNFDTREWTFTEDIPTVRQQFEAFPIGTKFNTFEGHAGDYFLKVGVDQVVLVNKDGKAGELEPFGAYVEPNSKKLYERKDA